MYSLTQYSFPSISYRLSKRLSSPCSPSKKETEETFIVSWKVTMSPLPKELFLLLYTGRKNVGVSIGVRYGNRFSAIPHENFCGFLLKFNSLIMSFRVRFTNEFN